ncbi:dienelactone hydrolase family protein [Yinghuangia soli]|uniref:Dienelactone hydrolase family protein n=1 Tax=Yinghuangia soli TaxID=2908204 RepID=A0AA41TZ49_9ACTN|nr:dienelactone hydrolase family protein [Yinghuangia soli]MCF2527131.1 dienelactone hydrolase family protein [Yinghuangia soli]
MPEPLTAASLSRVLGPIAPAAVGDVEIVSERPCEGYLLRHVAYDVPSGRASVFVCIPDGLTSPAPLVFCHHQHAGRFDLGKSEVVGLRGQTDQHYAAELARRGFVTIAPDAIGFEDRNWADGDNISWFELSSRLVQGRTLLADLLQEVSLAIDYGTSLPEADAARVGFIGHSYGGRMAIWAPAWDRRIQASVSNCGCIPYRDSAARDAGFQADFVIPGFARDHDVEDVISAARQCRYLLIAGDQDVWSRGASDIARELEQRGHDHATVHLRPGGHAFPAEDRRRPPTRLPLPGVGSRLSTRLLPLVTCTTASVSSASLRVAILRPWTMPWTSVQPSTLWLCP